MIDIVEQIARMKQVDRIKFVREFVTKWPQLAYDIKEAIQIEIFEQREQKAVSYTHLTLPTKA